VVLLIWKLYKKLYLCYTKLKFLFMKYNLKFILRTQKARENGLCPVVLRIYLAHKVGTKYEYLSSNIWVEQGQWDAKAEKVKDHPRKDEYNRTLDSFKVKVDTKVNQEFLYGNSAPLNVKELISSKDGPDFFEFARDYFNSQTSISESSRQVYFGHIQSFKLFLGRNRIPLKALNGDLLQKYLRHLKDKRSKPSTMLAKITVVKVVLRAAERKGFFSQSQCRFDDLKVAGRSDTHKIKFLTEDDLRVLLHLPENDLNVGQKYLDLFLFSALTGGLRFSDILDLRWSHFGVKGNAVYLQKRFVKSRKTSPKLFVGERALSILSKYGDINKSQGFVFHKSLGVNTSEYEKGDIFRGKEIMRINCRCNSYLRRLSAKLGFSFGLHFHCSRHTWATIALRSMPIQSVSSILGHSSINMTERYAKVLAEDLEQGQKEFLSRVAGFGGY
jgi:integrase/recombinase XerD